jgi:hypothetical protein
MARQLITHLCFDSVCVQAIATMIPRAEHVRLLREETNQINGSGKPLEAMEWKNCSGCTR